MAELKNALPAEGSIDCAQKRKLPEESMARYRRNLLLTLAFCILLADALHWPWGMGNTATVFAWYHCSDAGRAGCCWGSIWPWHPPSP